MDTDSKLQFPALVIDGSGSDVFAGVLGEDGQWITHTCQSGAPLEQLFTTVETTLEAAKIELEKIRSYIYCEGPGSVLGLRLCAMAIETWSRLYPDSANYFSYNTLQLCAKLLSQQAGLEEPTLLVSDWKKGAWNAITINDGQISETTVVDDATIAEHSGAVYHLPQRKGWQKPPSNAETIPYSPERLPELIVDSNWLKPTAGVELYSSGINTFAKWTPDRHRAATPKS
ncbi:MAG: hypothetical protein ACSHYA_05505 [Opitutaceae bacterium]